MNLARRSATGALAALTVVIAGPAFSASAQGYHFQNLVGINGGQLQACRVPTAASKPMTIKIRVNAKKAKSKLSGVGRATRNGTIVGKTWTSGWVRRGQVSKVGTIHVPRGTAYALDAGIGTGGMGNGGAFKPAKIRTCG